MLSSSRRFGEHNLFSDFPGCDSIRNSWARREDSESRKRIGAQRTKDGNAQFSLCCTSTVMPDDDSQDRHPAFCFRYGNRKQESNKRFGDVACASGLARKSSLSPTSSRRQPKRPVPYAQTSAKCSARDTAP